MHSRAVRIGLLVAAICLAAAQPAHADGDPAADLDARANSSRANSRALLVLGGVSVGIGVISAVASRQCEVNCEANGIGLAIGVVVAVPFLIGAAVLSGRADELRREAATLRKRGVTWLAPAITRDGALIQAGLMW
jgi:hypothetical protein